MKRRDPASIAAAAVLALLAAGLVPVWALAVQTPFRLIDDYGALVPLERSPAVALLWERFSLRENLVRFRPAHDLGQLLSWHVLAVRERRRFWPWPRPCSSTCPTIPRPDSRRRSSA